MGRSALYVLVGALAVAAAVLGYLYYQEQQTSGVEINIGEGGVSIEGN
jgi:hypothetical protein